MKFDQFESLLNAGVTPQVAIRQLELNDDDQFELIEFALSCGAGLVETAQLLASLEEIEAQTKAELSQAQQIPQSTKKLMLWLPWFGLLLSEFAGLGAIRAILSPEGLVLLVLAAGLSYVGNRISQRMTDRAVADMRKPEQPLLRLAIALQAGISLTEALKLSGVARDHQVVRFAFGTGVSLRELIRVQLRVELLTWRTKCLNLAKSLSVKLMVPLGLTTLPAFLLLTVAPVLLGALSKGET